MPFGAQIRTNRGLTDISNIFALELVDSRIISFGSTDSIGSFTVPIGKFTSFNNAAGFEILCYVGRSTFVPPSLRTLASMSTRVSYPSTITSSSNATVHYRGGTSGQYSFNTWISEFSA